MVMVDWPSSLASEESMRICFNEIGLLEGDWRSDTEIAHGYTQSDVIPMIIEAMALSIKHIYTSPYL